VFSRLLLWLALMGIVSTAVLARRSLLAGFTQLAHNLAGSRQVSTAFTFIYVGKTICK
jgi:hypothetical protein